MERLDGSVRRALRRSGVPDAGVLAAATRAWPTAVGQAIARAAWPQRIARDGTRSASITVAGLAGTRASGYPRLAGHGDTLVFVEVKTRRGLSHGHPFEAITPDKVRRLRTLAGLWLQERPHRGPIRMDAVGIIAPRTGEWRVEHLRGIA